jgi:hypothetical protein
MKIIVTLCRLSHDFFKYSSLQKIDGTKLVRMTHKVVESTGTPQDITRRLAFLEIWEIISSTTNTVHRADKQATANEFDFEGPSVTGTASGEVSNIMVIAPIWLVFFGSLFRHTLGDIGSNPR